MVNEGLLRYKISDWHQLPKSLSNNSRKLSIVVSDFIQDERLSGVRIQVNHEDFGVMFACIVNAGGNIVSESQENVVPELTPQQILTELQKFGYYVTYKPEFTIPTPQLVYITALKNLGFDKIRILYVHEYVYGIKQIKWHIVAFNVKNNPDWINNWYSPHKSEFLEALNNGSASNLSKISGTQKYQWDWLVDFVYSIDDILEDNS